VRWYQWQRVKARESARGRKRWAKVGERARAGRVCVGEAVYAWGEEPEEWEWRGKMCIARAGTDLETGEAS
jgi:hypothetical protein